MAARISERELEPGRYAQYQALRTRYDQEPVFKAVVDMYRNVSHEPEVAAHWMAAHDVETYANRDGSFRPLRAGYSQAELEFLVARDVKIL